MNCSVEGCTSPIKYKDLCSKHYKRQWRHGSPTFTMVNMNEGAICSVEECNRPAKKRTLCKMHYTRFNRYGRTENIRANKGEGRPMTTAGYILLSINGIRVYEHVHKAEKALGRELPLGAVVHHMNRVPWDNDTPLNLVVCPDQAYHMLLHKRGRDMGLY